MDIQCLLRQSSFPALSPEILFRDWLASYFSYGSWVFFKDLQDSAENHVTETTLAVLVATGPLHLS